MTSGRTRVLLLSAGLALCAGLACGGEEEEAAPEPARFGCARWYVRQSSHPGARLQLLDQQLSLRYGEAIDLRRDTPDGAFDCRLEVGVAADATSFRR
jgi:hypothetical protein